MTVTGKIYKIKDGITYVRTKRPEGCAHCENASVCGTHMTEIRAVNTVSANVGDTVRVTVEESNKTYLLLVYVFLLPVIIFFASYLLYKASPFLLVISFAATAAYFFGLKYLDKKVSASAVIAVITNEDTRCPDKK